MGCSGKSGRRWQEFHLLVVVAVGLACHGVVLAGTSEPPQAGDGPYEAEISLVRKGCVPVDFPGDVIVKHADAHGPTSWKFEWVFNYRGLGETVKVRCPEGGDWTARFEVRHDPMGSDSRGLSRVAKITFVPLRGGEPRRVNLVVPTWTARVSAAEVGPDGEKPLPDGVRIAAFEVRGEQVTDHSECRVGRIRNGELALHLPKPGKWLLSVVPDLGKPYVGELELNMKKMATDVPVRFVAEGRRTIDFEGKLVGHDGTAIPDASVVLKDRKQDLLWQDGTPTRTDLDGVFKFKIVEGYDGYSLEADSACLKGNRDAFARLPVEFGEMPWVWKVRMAEATLIAEVFYKDGQTVVPYTREVAEKLIPGIGGRSLYLKVIRASVPYSPAWARFHGRGNKAVFYDHHLAPGLYAVEGVRCAVLDERYYPFLGLEGAKSELIEVKADELPKRVKIVVSTPTEHRCTGRVVDRRGQPTADARVVLRNVMRPPGCQAMWYARTDRDGNYSVTVPCGQYVVIAQHARYMGGSMVTINKDIVVDLTLDRKAP